MQVKLVADGPAADTPKSVPAAAADPIELAISDQAKEMVAAAEKAYQTSTAAYLAETVSLEQVFAWSRRWLQAAVDAANSPGERGKVYRDHRDRMQQLFDEIRLKYTVGARGGEADRYEAARFYLAEANLWVDRDVKSLRGLGSGDATMPDKNTEARVDVYHLGLADPETVLKVLQTTLAGAPDVRMMVDAKSNDLIVNARPAEHAKIRELLGKLYGTQRREFVVNPAVKAGPNPAAPGVEIVTRTGPGMPASTQVTYEVKSPAELIKILQPLLAGQPRVEMKSLANNSQLIVSAPAEQQEAIRALVAHVDRVGTAVADGAAKVSEPQKRIVAKFTNVDPAAAQKMLPQLAPEGSNYQVIYDFQDKSLVVKAPPEQNVPTNTEAPAATGRTAEKK
jgi:type II secretory pathway component GspD/PulD (secretin)